MQTLFERMATRETADFIRGIKHDSENAPNLLDKLKITLRSVNAVVNHAEERQTTDMHIREWLNDLKDAMFEAQDLLDKIQVCKCCLSPPSLGGFSEKMKNLIGKFETLVKQKDVLGLREGVNQIPCRKLETTTSLAGKASVFGRNVDKDNVIKLLLSVSDYGSTSGDRICVLPIVGMGGVGKTTLAQLVYNDEIVKQQFDIKAWVCVSQEFDVFKLTKTILEAIPLTSDAVDLNSQQIKLKEFLHNKRFLIVLDDVWNESRAAWEILMRPLEYGARESCVLVTTRNENVASAVLPVPIPSYHLKPLADDDCWLLFSENAFEGGRFTRSTVMEDIGREIVKKCRGHPLAAKALGGLLRSKVDLREWVKVLESKIWDFPSDRINILPALMLSYYYLPSALKRCFAYCSIFPKSYQFRRKELVRLWMAEDLLPHPKRNGNVEQLGTEYFNDLASRSFFLNSGRKHFVMHDLIVDLAEFVSGEFSFRLEGEKNNHPSKRTRHLSYSKLQFDDLEKIAAMCENLRTFLPSQILSWPRCLNNEAVGRLISKHKSLRALSLSHCCNLTALPDSLGDLIHLRYLDLSSTPISKLPESMCSLHNLQTLLLINCAHLTELPVKMAMLTDLRCLDIRGTKLSKMPLHMGSLKNLQTLTGFVLGSVHGAGIEELKNFSFLKGKISISNLQNIIDPHDAMKANLLDKMQLNELMLSWSTNANDSKNVRSVLHWLEPAKTLKKLTIRNYGSTSFPAWLGDCQFSKLVSICIYDCVNCLSFPTLGQLPSLKALSLVGFMIVTHVDGLFHNNSSMEWKQSQVHNTPPFSCLETLRFENMPQWQEWLPPGEEGKEDEDGAFPCLKRLYIKNCPKLKGLNWIQKLPALEKIVITKCEQLVVVVPPTICELQLEFCGKVSIQRPLPQLLNLRMSGYNAAESLLLEGIDNRSCCIEKLSISSCPLIQQVPSNGIANSLQSLNVTNCEKIEFPMNQCFPCLESLCIKWSCDSLRSFIMDLFPKMVHLEIQGCQNLESLVVSRVHVQYLQSLNSLRICDCPNFVSFPEGGLPAPNLTSLQLEKCKNLKYLPWKMNKLLPSLVTLNIKECPELESFSEGGLPDSLNYLEIFHSAKLFANRRNWDLQRLPSLQSFAIAGICQDGESFPERWLLPSTLTSFHILALWNLKYLDEESLQQLTSLETLGIACCPKLQCMPAKLPSSISTLHIMRSPRLEERCRGKNSEDWPKIAHIPMIRINKKLSQ